MSTPAGNTGGDPTAPVADVLAALPPRLRIHALAKLLGRSSREVLAAVTELGADGRSVQSSVDRATALRVAEALGVTAAEPVEEPVAAAEPATEPPAAPEPVVEQAPPARVIPPTPVFASASPLFLPPEPPPAPVRPAPKPKDEPEPVEDDVDDDIDDIDNRGDQGDGDGDEGRPRRRRGRRGRGRGKGGQDDGGVDDVDDEPIAKARPDKAEKPDKQDKPVSKRKAKAEEAEAEDADEQDNGEPGDDAATRRRRRRRRRRGGADDESNPTDDDPPNTVVHVREAREPREEKDKPESDGRDEVRSVRGSTRLEAKRQRRRDGREAGRRRAPILSEAEFLARREAVDRAMVIRERGDRVQIGVLEDGVLVEHFVTQSGGGSLVGNVYLGRVQNVLPSMEAAFVDIGRGRNAVLYAGEVDWDAAGLEGKARKIEQALSTGDSVLVQVTKDPVGHKGARLTTQISLPGRFLVYVPGGGATGISRKLPENERRRLKDVLKRVVPEDAGVIIRTASEGVSEEELARDVRRLQAQWQVIKDKTEGTNGVRRVNSPALVYEEPDLLVKVVRDLFTEDFSALVVEGTTAWDTVDAYVRHVAPELADRLRKHVGNTDVFAEYRIEEQLLKALDRKVWLPSGGYLVIDRTEAMTVIDVNTGKFTGSGGNLEETVTRNNLESAEEIVRQLRLRDIGGIIVIDFIDMVLESNRDLVLRRLTECLGRDRTRHQVAEVTSLGLVQMTRKRVGTGLLEAFGTTCEHCKGRGVLVSTEPMSKQNGGGANGHSGGHSGGASGGGGNGHSSQPTRRSRGRGGDDGGREQKEQKEQKESAKQAAKEAAAQAAAQAAKEAVRDIAKASLATGESPEHASTPGDGGAAPAGTATSGTTSQETASTATGSAGPGGSAAAGAPAGGSATAGGAAAGSSTSTSDSTPAGSGGGFVTTEPTHRRTVRRASRPAKPVTGSAALDVTVSSASTGSSSTAADPSSADASSVGEGSSSGGAGSSSAGYSAAGASSAGGGSSDSGSSPAEAGASAGSSSAGASPASSSADSPFGAAGSSLALGSSPDTGSSPSEASSPSPAGSPSGSAFTEAGAPSESASLEASSAQGADTSATGESAGQASADHAEHASDRPEAPATSGPAAESGAADQADTPREQTNGTTAHQAEEPSVPAPATPPRRQPRRAASRPAGPPVSATHDG